MTRKLLKRETRPFLDVPMKLDKNDYRTLADNIYNRRRNWASTGIIYLPMEAGGLPFGEPLVDLLESEYGLKLTKLPIAYSRKEGRIYRPSREAFKDANEHLPDAMNLIWDDVVGRGTGTMNAYGFVLTGGVNDDNIEIASIIDNVGVTRDLHLFEGEGYDNNMTRKGKLEELYRIGVVSRDYIPSRKPKRRKKGDFEIPKDFKKLIAKCSLITL